MPALTRRFVHLLSPVFLGALTIPLLLPAPAAYAQSFLRITNSPIPDGIIGTPYSAMLVASGGVAPYTFQATTALPAGLSLSLSGVVSGTPQTPGPNLITIRIQDSAGTANGGNLYIQVNPAQITVAPAPYITAGVPVNQPLIASGGTPPYGFSDGGSLPAGFVLSSAGVLSGTSFTPGTYKVMLHVSDSAPAPNTSIANIPFLFTVNQNGQLIIDAGSGFSAGLGLHLNGAAALTGSTLTLLDDKGFEASSAWSVAPVDITRFTTDFRFRIQPGPQDYYGPADGFTFTLQNSNPGAIGNYGGDLGYAGIGHSVAVKFDLFDNVGEQRNTVGFYANGASPTFPSSVVQNLVDLSQNDLLGHLVYNGISLTLTVTDTITNRSSVYTQVMDLPTIIGSKTAYVGFTGGTGLFSSNTQIVNWTYRTP